MYCPVCGSYLNENAKYCPNCGKRLGDTNTLNVSSVKVEKGMTSEEIIGIIGIVLSVIGWPIGLIISIVGFSTFRDDRAKKYCKIGIILNIILASIVALFVLIFLILFILNPNILFPGGL